MRTRSLASRAAAAAAVAIAARAATAANVSAACETGCASVRVGGAGAVGGRDAASDVSVPCAGAGMVYISCIMARPLAPRGTCRRHPDEGGGGGHVQEGKQAQRLHLQHVVQQQQVASSPHCASAAPPAVPAAGARARDYPDPSCWRGRGQPSTGGERDGTLACVSVMPAARAAWVLLLLLVLRTMVSEASYRLHLPWAR